MPPQVAAVGFRPVRARSIALGRGMKSHKPPYPQITSFETLYVAGARAAYERALAIRQKALGRHPDTAQSLGWLGTLEAQSGDPGNARSHLRQALAIYQDVLPAGHPDIRVLEDHLARLA